MLFSSPGLAADLQRATQAQGDVCPTPMQAPGGPAITAGRNVPAGFPTTVPASRAWASTGGSW
jgi:hypothetical protein